MASLVSLCVCGYHLSSAEPQECLLFEEQGPRDDTQASLTQLCVALGPVVSDCGQQLFGGRTWFPYDISFGKQIGPGREASPVAGGWMALRLPEQGSATISCPRPTHRKATSCPTHCRVQMRVGERDIVWTLR